MTRRFDVPLLIFTVALVSGTVDAQGQPRHHPNARGCEVVAHLASHVVSVASAAAGADDRGPRPEQRLGAPRHEHHSRWLEVVEQRGRVVGGTQRRNGVGGVARP